MTKPVTLEFHQGLDYAVLMRPNETTDDAMIQVKYPDDEVITHLKRFAASGELLTALEQADEILRHNPDAGEPPRYRNARASKIIKDAIAKARGQS